ncbi:MAG: nicotinate (nicotinamide) nucleotide adenylyltransferase [Cellulosilyticaceae bacterium]
MKPVIIVFGGAFNPPTSSHFSLAEQVVSEYEEVEQVLFLPVSDRYPKKDLLGAAHRVEMLRRVCEKNPYFEVCTLEVDSSRLLSTLESLERIQENYPEHEIWFTMGTDNLRLITSWPGYEEILNQFKLLVLERGEDCLEKVLEDDEELEPYREKLIKAKDTIRSNCNSTLLRSKLRRGKSIRYLVPDEVYEYAKIKGLYTIVQP